MRLARPAAVLSLFLLLRLRSGRGDALDGHGRVLAAPTKLHGFLLRATSRPSTPSRARRRSRGSPSQGAKRYEFQIATSTDVRDARRCWRARRPASPSLSLGISLPVDHRHAVLALRPRPRPRARRHAPARGARRSASTCAGRRLPAQLDAPAGLVRWTTVDGATGVPGLVPRRGHGLPDADERRRRARVLLLPPGSRVDEHGALAHPRRARALRRHAEQRSPAVSYGPWSPTYTSANPPFAAGPLADVEIDLRRRLDAAARRPRTTSCPASRSAATPEPQRHDRRAVPRLRRDRQGLRQRRLPRRGRRQPRIRAALERDARPAENARRISTSRARRSCPRAPRARPGRPRAARSPPTRRSSPTPRRSRAARTTRRRAAEASAASRSSSARRSA